MQTVCLHTNTYTQTEGCCCSWGRRPVRREMICLSCLPPACLWLQLDVCLHCVPAVILVCTSSWFEERSQCSCQCYLVQVLFNVEHKSSGLSTQTGRTPLWGCQRFSVKCSSCLCWQHLQMQEEASRWLNEEICAFLIKAQSESATPEWNPAQIFSLSCGYLR